MITIYFKTTQISIKFLEQCILPRIIPVSKSVAVVNINFVRHPTRVVWVRVVWTGAVCVDIFRDERCPRWELSCGGLSVWELSVQVRVVSVGVFHLAPISYGFIS